MRRWGESYVITVFCDGHRDGIVYNVGTFPIMEHWYEGQEIVLTPYGGVESWGNWHKAAKTGTHYSNDHSSFIGMGVKGTEKESS